MDRAQANALLLLIADLSRILYAPPDTAPPTEQGQVHENGATAREPVTTS
jgi:hypothetical protein